MDDAHWLKRAKGRNVGGFSLLTAADSSGTEAMVFPTMTLYPTALFSAADDRAYVKTVGVEDAGHCYVEGHDFDGDGWFDAISFTTGAERDGEGISFTDVNLDGIPDVRMGPGIEAAAMIDCQWRELVNIQANTAQVQLDGKLTDVVLDNGVWRITAAE